MHIVLLESLGIPKEALDKLAQPLLDGGHSFTAYENTPFTEEIIAQAQGADVLMLANKKLAGEVITACEKLQFISVAFTGVDHIDLDACKAQGVKVSNAAGYATTAVAELTLCTILSLLRNVAQADARTREGGTKDGLVGNELRGKTVGIVGTGAIGLEVARLLQAFGCKCVAHAPREKQAALDMGIPYVSLEELMQQSDIITLHIPLNPSTERLIDARAISLMKPTAILINMARGQVIDSSALALALKQGKIRGAAVDVYEKEPPIYPAHPLLGAPNTLCTPHIAFATEESLLKRGEIAFDNIAAFLAGRQQNVIL